MSKYNAKSKQRIILRMPEFADFKFQGLLKQMFAGANKVYLDQDPNPETILSDWIHPSVIFEPFYGSTKTPKSNPKSYTTP